MVSLPWLYRGPNVCNDVDMLGRVIAPQAVQAGKRVRVGGVRGISKNTYEAKNIHSGHWLIDGGSRREV